MFRVLAVFALLVTGLLAQKVNNQINFDKNSTKVILFGKKNLAIELAKDENSKYNTIIQLTGSNLTRYKVCKKLGNIVECIKYGSGGKLAHIVETYNIKESQKKSGKYIKYYTAYIGNKNRYDCPIVIWDENNYKFISEDSRQLCKDEFRVRYLGGYKNGQKVGTWKTYNKKGELSSEKTYRYSKLRAGE